MRTRPTGYPSGCLWLTVTEVETLPVIGHKLGSVAAEQVKHHCSRGASLRPCSAILRLWTSSAREGRYTGPMPTYIAVVAVLFTVFLSNSIYLLHVHSHKFASDTDLENTTENDVRTQDKSPYSRGRYRRALSRILACQNTS